MKTYVLTTGVIFGLLTVVHVWRAIEERAELAKDPWFLLISVAAAALCCWAFRLLWLARRPDETTSQP